MQYKHSLCCPVIGPWISLPLYQQPTAKAGKVFGFIVMVFLGYTINSFNMHQ